MSGKQDALRRRLLTDLRLVFGESEVSLGDQVAILDVMKDELLGEYEQVHNLEEEGDE